MVHLNAPTHRPLELLLEKKEMLEDTTVLHNSES